MRDERVTQKVKERSCFRATCGLKIDTFTHPSLFPLNCRKPPMLKIKIKETRSKNGFCKKYLEASRASTRTQNQDYFILLF